MRNIAGIALAATLVACGNSVGIGNVTSRSDGESLERLSPPASLEGVVVHDGLVTMDVPVDVVLIGFPREAAVQLAAGLTPRWMAQTADSFARIQSPTPFTPGIFAPRAIFQVRAAPRSLADGYRAALQAAPSDAKYHDGNAAEAWLMRALAQAGFVADPARPALVLVHQGAESAGYAYDYGNGPRAPVRVMGKGSLLIMDLSAEADPWVGSGSDYDQPLELDDPSLAHTLRAAVIDAATYRLLQGTLYLPSMKTCHALTVVAAKRVTGVVPGAPGFPLDVEQFRSTFSELTGDEVFVDVKELTLPIDDPALDLFTRLISDGVGEMDQVAREWVERNWSSYHVPHEGCEEYLTLVLSGDVADVQGRGTAEYDDGNGHRFAYTIATNICMTLAPLGVYPPTGIDCTGIAAPSDHYRMPNALATHESGHLFGLRHPHDISTPDGSFGNWAFSSLATSMSYELDDHMLGFGAIDVNNFRRNRAATALWKAERAGHADESVFGDALAAMAAFRWDEVTHALRVLDLTPVGTPPPVPEPPTNESEAGTCTLLPPGTTVESLPGPTCPGCTASDEALAADGDLTTFAVLRGTQARGGGVLRATLPPGVVLPGGTIPGVFLVGDPWLAFNIFIRTYLDGQQQDLRQVAGSSSGGKDPTVS